MQDFTDELEGLYLFLLFGVQLIESPTTVCNIQRPRKREFSFHISEHGVDPLLSVNNFTNVPLPLPIVSRTQIIGGTGRPLRTVSMR